jgi:hypothetical protein
MPAWMVGIQACWMRPETSVSTWIPALRSDRFAILDPPSSISILIAALSRSADRGRINSMADEAAQAKDKVRAWTDAHRHAVLYDEENPSLMDVASGKTIRLLWQEVTTFEEKVHPETGDNYLVLLFENGTQVALVDPGGIAFAPSTENSGPLPNVPPVVCLKDFFTLKGRLDHYLYDHPDQPPPKEALDLVMICIATLDGARAVGFEVGDLEGELEKSLKEIERRTS